MSNENIMNKTINGVNVVIDRYKTMVNARGNNSKKDSDEEEKIIPKNIAYEDQINKNDDGDTGNGADEAGNTNDRSPDNSMD